jgi:hypothetical protein
MTTAHTDTTDLRTVTFYAPTDMRGKFHTKAIVTNEAECGAGVILGYDSIAATVDALTNKKFHPIICRKCARLSITKD